ncbi:MAG TPA: pyridoxal phosphate-dependent aminotransferase [Caulobacteraceae bacterium]|nr:pyridoxal phosphate-dependent aminotransferase [Caulobacteraceae bacterium]
MRHLQSDYMHFAKFRAGATYDLATSGVKDCALEDLGLTWDDLALHGPNASGYGPLMEIVAARFGVARACVVMPGGGASFANHLALAALVRPGDEVLVERPTYELLTDTLRYLQADIRRFDRLAADGWSLDPTPVIEALRPTTRLVVLTHLHNPSSAPASDPAIDAIAQAAERVGARVFIDETYRELTFEPGAAATSFRPGGNIVTTSSLTKAYGVSGLRCGWILADPPLAERMRRLNDLYGVAPPHISERMSVVTFQRLPQLKARATALVETNRGAYRDLLGGHPALEQTMFDAGTTVFPRLKIGDGAAFAERLAARGVAVVPGGYFEAPDHIRIGLGGDAEMTRAGLEILAETLR